jgi:hypothetical protein
MTADSNEDEIQVDIIGEGEFFDHKQPNEDTSVC